MSSTYQAKVCDLHKRILAEEYFLSLWREVLTSRNMTESGLFTDQYSATDLTEMLNEFWFALPDESYIRRGPFFLLCDLCEGEDE